MKDNMNDWTSGYIADIDYIYGYYQELNPLRVRLAFLNAGLACPGMGAACELGFGQGVNANFHAAASLVQWHGTDFNPSQVVFARELAAASGAGAKLHDEAFEEFANRSDLPDFDYICLHGIWSWISDGNRAIIVDFIRRKLKVGGVLYVSYNTQPGWAAMVPMRDMLTQYCEVMGASGKGTISRINEALAFADQLIAVDPAYVRINPQVAERMNKIRGQNRNYLAHEYFNRDWLPMPFFRMADWLAPAKLTYACSAHYLDHIDSFNLSAEQRVLIQNVPDLMLKEMVRDFCVNQQFRRDYWVKGVRKLSALEQREALSAQRVMLISHRTDVSLRIDCPLGEAVLGEAVYNPILEALADHKPKTLGQVEAAVKDKGVNFTQLLQAVMILAGAGHFAAVQDEATIVKAKKQTDKLNAHIMHKARGGNDIGYLASPVTGGGIAVDRFQQLFLLALSQGSRQPAELASFAWEKLQAQGQRLVKEGKELETAESNLVELTAHVNDFVEKRWVILKALQIV